MAVRSASPGGNGAQMSLLRKASQQALPSLAEAEGGSLAEALVAQFPGPAFCASADGVMAGYIPYVNTIATFLTRRCYEQLAVDLCLHNLPVRLIANGGGLVYAPLGPTYLAVEDLAILRVLPNMTILVPADAEEMRRLMPQTVERSGPCYVRLAKGGDEVISRPDLPCELGKAILLRPPVRLLLIGTGIASGKALHAANRLAERGLATGVLHLHTLKPLDDEAIVQLAAAAEAVVTVEEHCATGGLGTAVLEVLATRLGRRAPALLRLGIPDRFAAHYGTQEELLAHYGLDPPGIAQAVEAFIGGAVERAA
ncbi:MAG: transketolase [Alphaproteobacteria bacterium]|nr:transketolase [Alphaproteobacteria bacterium]